MVCEAVTNAQLQASLNNAIECSEDKENQQKRFPIMDKRKFFINEKRKQFEINDRFLLNIDILSVLISFNYCSFLSSILISKLFTKFDLLMKEIIFETK